MVTAVSSRLHTSIAELKAEIETLRPEVAGIEGVVRPRGADHRAAGQRRELRRIDDAIDLVADTQDAAPVEERVAKRQTDVLRHGVAKVEAELRHDGKLVLAVLAKVRRQR